VYSLACTIAALVLGKRLTPSYITNLRNQRLKIFEPFEAACNAIHADLLNLLQTMWSEKKSDRCTIETCLRKLTGNSETYDSCQTENFFGQHAQLMVNAKYIQPQNKKKKGEPLDEIIL